MTDNTQSGSDINVTSKHPSTEVEADKIKDTQAEQSAKIAHTTQAELDHIVDINDMVVDNSLDGIFDKMGYTKNTDFRKEATRLIADWHNKQIETIIEATYDNLPSLDKLTVGNEMSDGYDQGVEAFRQAIEAERNKLKESTDE